VPVVFEVEGTVLLVALLASVAIKIFAFVNSLMYSREAYSAANKLTKPAWCAILGVGVAWALIFMGHPLQLVNLVFLIAAFVYLADVRPALSSLTRR
jgi:Protein of unknown function (DUF2516)